MDEYTTSDLGLAAAIVANGTPVSDIRGDGMKKTFVFPDAGQMRAIANSYWENRLQVQALAYFNATRTLKNQLHDL